MDHASEPHDASYVWLSRDLDALLWKSCRDQDSAWLGHVAFAHWIVNSCRPRSVVELGTHMGVSFAAFCNAVTRSHILGRCVAVDTWEGDKHAGFYGNEIFEDLEAFVQKNFAGTAVLMRCLFDEALDAFDDGSIDLLHIDGLHTYDAVKHDFVTWLPKLSDRGVVLFHDTDIFDDDFGVHALWGELTTQYPSFRFTHSAGLGVLAVGREAPPAIRWLCSLESHYDVDRVRTIFAEFSERASDLEMRRMREKLDMLAARMHDVLAVDFGENIALNCRAAQSSVLDEEPSTADAAVNGDLTQRFAFHTQMESNPWWVVDLKTIQQFDNILIYNRNDDPCAPRARTLSVLASPDGMQWSEIYRHDETVFGDLPGIPLHVRCQATWGRFVRVQLNEVNYLHLVQVEIYAPRS